MMNPVNICNRGKTIPTTSQKLSRIVMLSDNSFMSKLFFAEAADHCKASNESTLVLRVDTSTRKHTASPNVPKMVKIVRLLSGNIGLRLLTKYLMATIKYQFTRYTQRPKIPTYLPTGQNINSEACISNIDSYSPDLILVMGCEQIISEKFLNTFPDKVVNFHWSLLPNHKGRGATLIPLLDNSEQTGVTYHLVSENLDGGDILYQDQFTIAEGTKQAKLHFILIMMGIQSINPFLSKWHNKEIASTPQRPNDSKPITSKQLRKTYYIDHTLRPEQLLRRMDVMGYQIEPQSGLCVTDLQISTSTQINFSVPGEIISKTKNGIEIQVTNGSVLIKSFLYLPTILSVQLWKSKVNSCKKCE